ncbi:hypothetical protein GQ53DRAFT_746060 [Thozetella sp. PMI_491]|nr:hypothetical protein GQ53DRAFT_746060 [Thozetella sp. PMI_491]
MEDAPYDEVEESLEDEPPHPSTVKTFPGPSGWTGPISTASVVEETGVRVKLGWEGVGASVQDKIQRTKTEKGSVKVAVVRKGRQRNSLIVTVAEDPIDAAGIPDYLTIPLIVTHHSRRFSMRVTLHARFGFWRGKLAEIVPVLGRTDEPLFFDPLQMRQMMDNGQRGIGGTKVVEWHGELEDIDLLHYSSLKEA